MKNLVLNLVYSLPNLLAMLVHLNVEFESLTKWSYRTEINTGINCVCVVYMEQIEDLRVE